MPHQAGFFQFFIFVSSLVILLILNWKQLNKVLNTTQLHHEHHTLPFMPPFMLLNIRLWLKQRLASLAHHFLSHPQWDFATSCMSNDMPAPCLSPVLANSHISGQSMLFIIHCWPGLQWCKGFKCTGNRHTQTSTHRRCVRAELLWNSHREWKQWSAERAQHEQTRERKRKKKKRDSDSSKKSRQKRKTEEKAWSK